MEGLPLNAPLELRMNSLIDQLTEQLNGRRYDMVVQIYSQNTYIPPARKCFAVMFTNIGDTPATLKGMIVFPSATPTTALGDSRTISGHKNDIYSGTLDLSFRAPLGVTPAIEVVQLYYVD